MVAFDSWLDLDLQNYANFVALKSKNPNVKLIIAIGGWTDSQNNKAAYKEMFASPAKRQNFAMYVITILQIVQLDNICKYFFCIQKSTSICSKLWI